MTPEQRDAILELVTSLDDPSAGLPLDLWSIGDELLTDDQRALIRSLGEDDWLEECIELLNAEIARRGLR